MFQKQEPLIQVELIYLRPITHSSSEQLLEVGTQMIISLVMRKQEAPELTNLFKITWFKMDQVRILVFLILNAVRITNKLSCLP